jgi:ABC-type sugar transport system permease subunit
MVACARHRTNPYLYQYHKRFRVHLKKTIVTAIGWLFGLILIAAGIVNMFWGNDQGLGIGLCVLSPVFFPPSSAWLQQKSGLPFPWWAKLALALLLVWVTLGVGELLPKIGLMLKDIR